MHGSRIAMAVALAGISVSAVHAQSVIPGVSAAQPRVVGRTVATSGAPEWPRGPVAPKGAPNVLIILTDDTGFASSSVFGGPVPMPNLATLAQTGLRYNAFNTTALCSPTRASLLSGRYPHNVNVGRVTNFPTGYDGYTSIIPPTTALVPRILLEHGYSTAAFGKWHLTPEWEESSVGPFNRWPTGQGFEYFYGFMGGDANQFAPALVEGTRRIDPPTDDPNYILDKDLANHAIGWLDQHNRLASDKPFFMYYATGTSHSPHHAPRAWIDRFAGKFDRGWDAMREESFARQKRLGIIPANAQLTPRPAFLAAWDSLSSDRKRVYARLMEAYAGALAYSDDQIGRVIDHLRETGEFDNTLIVYIVGDNGSSAEGGEQGMLEEDAFINLYKEDFSELVKHIDDIGGPKAYNHYPAAWAWAMNTPFQYYKQVASHFGGTRNAMVVSWPAQIVRPEIVRPQFHHVADVVPTILEAAGIEEPTVVDGVSQKPFDGISFAYTFKQPAAPDHRTTQVFEMMQNLGIYKDGWFAGTKPMAAPWEITKPQKFDLNSREWELYQVSKDFSEANNLAAADPAKLDEMKGQFFVEAAKNNILPIHGIGQGAAGKPSLLKPNQTSLVFHVGDNHIPEAAAPHIIGRGFRITADVDIAPSKSDGVLVTHGGRFGGYVFYIKDGRLKFTYNATAQQIYNVAATDQLTYGHHLLVAEFTPDKMLPGTGGGLTLSVDGKVIAKGRVEHTHVTWIAMSEYFDVGEDTLTPVTDDYDVEHSKFAGDLRELKFDLK